MKRTVLTILAALGLTMAVLAPASADDSDPVFPTAEEVHAICVSLPYSITGWVVDVDLLPCEEIAAYLADDADAGWIVDYLGLDQSLAQYGEPGPLYWNAPTQTPAPSDGEAAPRPASALQPHAVKHRAVTRTTSAASVATPPRSWSVVAAFGGVKVARH